MRTFIGAALIVLVVAVAGNGQATQPTPEFAIEEFDFVWKVAAQGEDRLLIDKNQERVVVRLQGRMESITMTPADAEKVGSVLQRVDEFAAKYKAATGDVSETIAAGEMQVRFSSSEKTGFYLSVSSKRLSFSSVLLDRKSAKLFAPHLVKARKMASFVDARIQP